jgi:hypothetical protein
MLTAPPSPAPAPFFPLPRCRTRYNEWLLCVDKTDGADICDKFKGYAFSICPADWTNKWDEDREGGTWVGYKAAGDDAAPGVAGHH